MLLALFRAATQIWSGVRKCFCGKEHSGQPSPLFLAKTLNQTSDADPVIVLFSIEQVSKPNVHVLLSW